MFEEKFRQMNIKQSDVEENESHQGITGDALEENCRQSEESENQQGGMGETLEEQFRQINLDQPEEEQVVFPAGGMACPVTGCRNVFFPTFSGMQHHYHEVHSRSVSYRLCSLCSESFKRFKDYRVHLLRIHHLTSERTEEIISYTDVQKARNHDFIDPGCFVMPSLPTMPTSPPKRVLWSHVSTPSHVHISSSPEALSCTSDQFSSQLFNRRLALNCGLWNARSLTGKIGELKSVIIKKDIDIMFLTETWLKCQSNPIVSEIRAALNDYTFHYKSRENRRGGGVAILAKSNVEVLNTKTYPYKSFESIEVTLRCHHVSVQSIVIYRPPQSAVHTYSKSDFIKEFTSLLDTVLPSSGLVLIGGDFNFDFLNKNSHDSLKLVELLNSRDLKQHVGCATHEKGKTLDLIITRTTDDIITDLKTHDRMKSDHSLIHFKIIINEKITCENIKDDIITSDTSSDLSCSFDMDGMFEFIVAFNLTYNAIDSLFIRLLDTIKSLLIKSLIVWIEISFPFNLYE